MRDFFHRRIIQPIKRLLTQGITPRKIALTLALGVVLGLFPVMGSTSLLCAGAAVALRLNLPAIQAVNYVMYPLQLLMIVPFIRAGEYLFRANQTTLTLAQMIGLMKHEGIWQAMHTLWILAVQGIAAWLLAAPVAFGIFYGVFLAIANRLHPAGSARAAGAGA
jgi:uncharacterized protein (DUF2062 family)